MAASCKDGRVTDSLREMFKTLSHNMTQVDADRLKNISVATSNIGSMWRDRKCQNIPRKIYKTDAFSFFRYLEEEELIDETNLCTIRNALRIYNQNLYELSSTKRKVTVQSDPVVDYLEKTSPKQLGNVSCSPPLKRRCSQRLQKQQSGGVDCKTVEATIDNSSQNADSWGTAMSHTGFTCDVRLRVKAEYLDHQDALAGNIATNKEHLLEQQFDKFNQASTILKSRDLGSVVCDIKFSELTYLDAFWRDYINGSLLEALKGVFITETLQQAVGEEPLRLLVSVDEDDYRSGRLKLLRNLPNYS